MIVQTAAEAFAKYREAYENDGLAQSVWNTERDGRHLACALGVLGEEVTSVRDCPAQIMPRWLAQMVPYFFDGMETADAKQWGLEFYEQLARIKGAVPFRVVHDWQANFVGPLAIETAEKQGRDVEAHKALADMQAKALGGTAITDDEWRPVLKAAFYDLYKWLYRANADAAAYVYAAADAYAAAAADAYADAYAYVNAYVNANANADGDAYADAYAYVNAKRDRIKRLAFGMVECLKRVPDGQ